MLVEMQEQLFNSLEDETLVLNCTEPTAEQIRGKSMRVKSRVISSLTSGQQASFLFRVLYSHANSTDEYYAWISYLLQQTNYWSGVTGALRFFGDNTKLQLYTSNNLMV